MAEDDPRLDLFRLMDDDEIYEAVENSNSVLVKDMARAIEAKLKGKNGG